MRCRCAEALGAVNSGEAMAVNLQGFSHATSGPATGVPFGHFPKCVSHCFSFRKKPKRWLRLETFRFEDWVAHTGDTFCSTERITYSVGHMQYERRPLVALRRMYDGAAP